MRYFRQQGKSDHEVMEALEAKFGDSFQITTRKMVKLGGIFGVGRRTGVEYCGYIKEKASSIAGSNMDVGMDSEREKAQKKSAKRNGQGALQGANSDEKNRDEILARFVKNKEVQRWLQETKIGQKILEDRALPPSQVPAEYSGESQREEPGAAQPARVVLPEAPQFEARSPESGGFELHGSELSRTEAGANLAPTSPMPADASEPPRAMAQRSEPPLRHPGYESYPASHGQENWDQEKQGVWEKAVHQRQYSGAGQPHPYYEGGASPPSAFISNAPNARMHGSNHSSNRYISDDEESLFLRRLENLERKVERRSGEPSSLAQFRESLYQNEFPPFFADRLIAQIRRELPLEALEKMEGLWEHVLLYIAENMRFIEQKPHSRIMVLVGPTGVGKTTTIAKLAARQCVEAMGGKKKIHLITLDNYRIGAQDQIRTYGEILGAKVDCIETQEGLASCIEQDQESDMILIDTMGRSPSDHMKLAEMRQFLEASGDCEIHLAMSATSGVSAMKEIITQFKPFGFRSVILTKLDELGRIGAVLATFLQEDIPLSYLTTGQKVPQDICPASALALFRNLVDVELDWQSFEQKLEENMP